MSKTFSIIKPDATNRNITGAINKIIEENDLVIVAQKRIKLSKIQAEGFYAIHKEKPFFNDFFTFSNILILYFLKQDIIVEARNINIPEFQR